MSLPSVGGAAFRRRPRGNTPVAGGDGARYECYSGKNTVCKFVIRKDSLTKTREKNKNRAAVLSVYCISCTIDASLLVESGPNVDSIRLRGRFLVDVTTTKKNRNTQCDAISFTCASCGVMEFKCVQ